MKRILLICLAALTLLSLLSGCGKEKRELYNTSLKKYVTLGEYKNMEVDTSSDDYKSVYDTLIKNDRESNRIPEKTGIVADGDMVNIDYVGKKDGIAFSGGTASGYNLTIGSNSFIDGFEMALIGKEIGKKTTINVTFPENYGEATLAGQPVTFDVTLNYKNVLPELDDAFAAVMGFDSLDAYTADVKAKAAARWCLGTVINNSEVKDYPEKDFNRIYEFQKELYSKSYNNNYELFLSSNSLSDDDFKSYIQNSMQSEMIYYYIFDLEKLEYSEEDMDKLIGEIASSNNTTTEKLKEEYDNSIFESEVVYNKVLDYFTENAVIK